MIMRPLATLLGATALTGCVETVDQLPDRVPVGSAGQEQVCAAAFADQLNVPMSSIRVNGRDISPSGNAVIFLQSADLFSRANCEVNSVGNVIAIVSTS
jgi:hypothetical protein